LPNEERVINRVQVSANGPLVCAGALVVTAADGSVLREAESLAFCRCGASQNKPFCDGSHRGAEFADAGIWSDDKGVAEVSAGPVTFKLAPNGPLLVDGPVVVEGADGEVRFAGQRAALCRCGHSDNKPWCDGSHKSCGFVAD
jgi:CDGSH-type Zn-finger protein